MPQKSKFSTPTQPIRLAKRTINQAVHFAQLLEQGYVIQAQAALPADGDTDAANVVRTCYTLEGFEVLDDQSALEAQGGCIQPSKTSVLAPEENLADDEKPFEFRHRFDRNSPYSAIYRYFIDHQDQLGIGIREQVERMLRAFWLPVVYFDSKPNIPESIQKQIVVSALAALEAQIATIRDLYDIPATEGGYAPALMVVPSSVVPSPSTQENSSSSGVSNEVDSIHHNEFPTPNSIRVLGL